MYKLNMNITHRCLLACLWRLNAKNNDKIAFRPIKNLNKNVTINFIIQKFNLINFDSRPAQMSLALISSSPPTSCCFNRLKQELTLSCQNIHKKYINTISKSSHMFGSRVGTIKRRTKTLSVECMLKGFLCFQFRNKLICLGLKVVRRMGRHDLK